MIRSRNFKRPHCGAGAESVYRMDKRRNHQTVSHATDAAPPTPAERDFLVTIGRNIRQARIAANLSQRALAERAGHRQTYLSRIEAGKANVTALTLLRIARAAHVNVTSLLEA